MLSKHQFLQASRRAAWEAIRARAPPWQAPARPPCCSGQALTASRQTAAPGCCSRPSHTSGLQRCAPDRKSWQPACLQPGSLAELSIAQGPALLWRCSCPHTIAELYTLHEPPSGLTCGPFWPCCATPALPAVCRAACSCPNRLTAPIASCGCSWRRGRGCRATRASSTCGRCWRRRTC